MGLFHPEELPWARRALVGAPKASSSIHGEFVDTAQHPEQPDPRHDAQAAYDPDAMPVQNVRNPCEGDDDHRPGGEGGSIAVWLAAGVVMILGLLAGLHVAARWGWL